MSAPTVVIPYRSKGGKSRLAGALTASEREELSELMLLDVLGAIAGAGLAGRCLVVSPDASAAEVAEGEGATTLLEEAAAGVSAAVRRAMDESPRVGTFMVVPADVPSLRHEEVTRALSFFRAGMDVVLTPSREFNGTNLLLFRRGRMPELSYDKDSFWNHVASSARRGLRLCAYTAGGLMSDVDTLADLKALGSRTSRGRAATFAREVLR